MLFLCLFEWQLFPAKPCIFLWFNPSILHFVSETELDWKCEPITPPIDPFFYFLFIFLTLCSWCPPVRELIQDELPNDFVLLLGWYEFTRIVVNSNPFLWHTVIGTWLMLLHKNTSPPSFWFVWIIIYFFSLALVQERVIVNDPLHEPLYFMFSSRLQKLNLARLRSHLSNTF